MRRVIRIAVAVTILVAIPTAALAAFAKAANSGGSSFATATLAPPTNLVATDATCVPRQGKTPGTREIQLNWSASASSITDGYEILRSEISGGPYLTIAVVSGQTTTSYVDSNVRHGTAYYYVVKATKNLWRSANSNQAVENTPNQKCK